MLTTVCVSCGTEFRVTPEQLKLREGRVRCGRCDTVFNALATLTQKAEFVTPVADPFADNAGKIEIISVSTAEALPVARPPEPEPETDEGASWPLICGLVVDETGAPVVGARVTLADLELGARTDRRGRFCIAAPPGDRTLSVVAAGFATNRRVVSLGTENLDVSIALAPAP